MFSFLLQIFANFLQSLHFYCIHFIFCNYGLNFLLREYVEIHVNANIQT